VERPAGAVSGSNDFYVIKYGIAGDNPRETADADNDELAGAEALTPSTGEREGSFFVLASMGEGAVDYFSFEIEAGDDITVACSSASGGSGVLGFRGEVRDNEDSVIRGADEDASGMTMRGINGLGAGTYYLRLSATGQSAEVTGDWARCGVHAGPPNN
jgi:hypothetical protein